MNAYIPGMGYIPLVNGYKADIPRLAHPWQKSDTPRVDRASGPCRHPSLTLRGR